MNGVIIKALSGFYYVQTKDMIIECRARGHFRKEGLIPLVGDKVQISDASNGKGMIDFISERRNSFQRPAVANIDCMVVLASEVNPITDPFIIDRVTVAAENSDCEVIICINKSDLSNNVRLRDIYSKTGYKVIETSAKTCQGIEELQNAIKGKICVFTGNSGVGKSSILNALSPEFKIKVGDVSEKLGRGRHTTRHVEMFSVGENTYIADTPGFSSFDNEKTTHIPKENLQFCFPEFTPYLGKCRFDDCAHLKEKGCAIIKAVNQQEINKSRHENYKKLYDISAKVKDWQIKSKHDLKQYKIK